MNVIIPAVAIVLLSALVLGWTDGFHAVVGLPVLFGIVLLASWIFRRVKDEDPAEAEEPETIRMLVLGVAGGLLALIPISLGFVLAGRTPLYAWFYDSACDSAIAEAQVLNRAAAYESEVILLENVLGGRLSPNCIYGISQQKVHARLTWAEQTSNAEKSLQLLRTARDEAASLNLPGLVELIDAKHKTLEQQQLIESQEEKLKRTEALLLHLQNADFTVQASSEGLVITLPDVLFDSGKATLAASNRQKIADMASLLQRRAKGPIRVEGHTDKSGPPDLNQRLSQERAGSVAAALIAAGVPAARVQTQGFGATRPLQSNVTAEGRNKNRRVQIIVQ